MSDSPNGDLYAIADRDRRFIEVSPAACRLLGYEENELLGKRVDDISAPSGAHVPVAYSHFLKQGEMAGRFLLRHKQGGLIEIEFSARVLDGDRMISHWKPRQR